MIVLVGFMGAGKSSVGRAVADLLSLPFVDTDEIVARRAGRSIPELFADGEGAFRRVERAAVVDALRGPDAVVALGGGALDDPDARGELESATVVHLQVSLEEALRRIDGGVERPMVARSDPARLYSARAETYARAADVTVATDRRTPDEVAREVVAVMEEARGQGNGGPFRRIRVDVDPSYDVVVGPGARASVVDVARRVPDAEAAAVVTHPSLRALAQPVADALETILGRAVVVEVPEGERSKSLRQAERVLEALVAAPLHRHDVIVAVGGGVITDLGGFVASTFHRGLACAHVPTTLMGQVDAAVGGKTAVNARAAKNAIGTFHHPIGVWCDVTVLRSLPEREMAAGLAEVVKYGLIADPVLLDIVRERAAAIRARDDATLADVVAGSVTVKAGIVADDERDQGVRAHLNYGHTFAHAMEAARGYDVGHGDAVALGMMAAAFAAHDLGLIDASLVELHENAIAAAGLPTRASFEFSALEGAWERDKKYRRGVRFVLLDGLARPRAGIDVPRDVLKRAIERLRR